MDHFLERFSLRRGPYFIGSLMAAAFSVCAVAGVVLVATWDDRYEDLTGWVGSDPITQRNDMLDRVYPMFLRYLFVGIRIVNHEKPKCDITTVFL